MGGIKNPDWLVKIIDGGKTIELEKIEEGNPDDFKFRALDDCFVQSHIDYVGEAWRNNSIVQELIELKKRVAELEERAMK